MAADASQEKAANIKVTARSPDTGARVDGVRKISCMTPGDRIVHNAGGEALFENI